MSNIACELYREYFLHFNKTTFWWWKNCLKHFVVGLHNWPCLWWWLWHPYIILFLFDLYIPYARNIIVLYTTQDYTDLPGEGQAKKQAVWGAENSGERVRCTSGCSAVQRSAHDVADMWRGKSKYHCFNKTNYFYDIPVIWL